MPTAVPLPTRHVDRRALLVGAGAAPLLLVPDAAQAGLRADLDRALRSRLGSRASRVAVSVYDRRSRVLHGFNPTMSTECASIAKVLLLATLLRTRRRQGRAFSADDRAVATRMICYSDNAAANTVQARAGGSSAVRSMAADLGMRHTLVNGAWGLTTTTSDDQLLLLRHLGWGSAQLTAADRDEIRALMARVTPSQRFGVGAISAPGAVVRLKNGWLPRSTGAWRHNSIGFVQGGGYDYALAILTRGNATDTAGRALTNDVARLVHAQLRTPLR